MHRNQLLWQFQASCTSQNQPHHFILNKQDAPSGALKRISRGLFAEVRVGQREAVVLRHMATSDLRGGGKETVLPEFRGSLDCGSSLL